MDTRLYLGKFAESIFEYLALNMFFCEGIAMADVTFRSSFAVGSLPVALHLGQAFFKPSHPKNPFPRHRLQLFRHIVTSRIGFQVTCPL